MKMPVAPDGRAPVGIWSSFVTWGWDYRNGGFGGTASSLDAGETDVLEWLGRAPSLARQRLHASDDSHAEWTNGLRTRVEWSGWHTYAIDRLPGRIDFLIDRRVVWTQTSADATSGAWDFNKAQYVVLNAAVGEYGKDPIPSKYPASTLIDYVRYWR